MRRIVLDTETTGLETSFGHRIIEIGCVELLDRKLTGNHFHVYLNPEREIDAGAAEVHGLSTEFLSDKPKFKDIATDLLGFLKGAELVIHNAPFDVGFLNYELRLLSGEYSEITECCTVLDTLALAKSMHPGQRNNLDALCKRYGVDNSHRDLHGALLDAEILAEVYLAMTGGQTLLALEAEPEIPVVQVDAPTVAVSSPTLLRDRPKLRVIHPCEPERDAHNQRLAEIAKVSNGKCLWISDV
jgi:DNA polymerase-3 subunit epsilon